MIEAERESWWSFGMKMPGVRGSGAGVDLKAAEGGEERAKGRGGRESRK